MKKSEYIHEVKPKAAIEASGIKTLRHGRIVVVDHHVALAFETFHYKFFPVLIPGPVRGRKLSNTLTKPIQYNRDAARQKTAPKDG